MKKRFYLILTILLSSFLLINNLDAATTKASSQFKSYDKRESTGDSSVTYKDHSNSVVGNLTNTGVGIAVDQGLDYAKKQVQNYTNNYIQKIHQYASNNMPAQNSYRSINQYRQAVSNLRQAENKAVQMAQKDSAKYIKGLNAAGNAYSAYNLYNDITKLNDESKHKHSSLKQLALTTRYMKVLYSGGAMFNKGLQGAANVSSVANDIVESDEFVDWANEQDNAFLDFLDDITDKVNDKVYKDTCEMLEWLGVNPPNSLPALRTAIKPNIYLYPLEESEITVKFDSPELLLTVIPDYPGEWKAKVSANSDMIIDGEKYTYLFYESATSDNRMQKENGFIVKKENREEFFKTISKFYGFNERETNDFVEFWTNRLDSDKEYYMYPQLTKTIDILMGVKIYPNPDNIFRIWFLFEEINDEKELNEPVKEVVNRDGYEMVEWGGIVAE